MKEVLGWEVVAPIMSERGWTIEQETEVLLQQIDENGPFDIVAGSSMGGLAAANASALRPDESFSLLLVAPAFGLDELWRVGAGRAGLEKWENEGSIQYFHHGLGSEITLGWDFFLAAERMSQPPLRHPTIIVHGTEDDTVPIDNSRAVAARESCVKALIEVEDGHRMQKARLRFAEAAAILGVE